MLKKKNKKKKTAVKHTVRPVSYTHLDVYKRQRLCNAKCYKVVPLPSLTVVFQHTDTPSILSWLLYARIAETF